jgi:ribose 5-phosphate isomerase B
MTIYLGADHRGFPLKEKIEASLTAEGYSVVDCGAVAIEPNDDYPDFAAKVAEAISKDPENGRGIVICGSGFGVDIAANRFSGVRSALAMSPDHLYAGRHDDDVNVLAIAANFIDEETALKMTKVFLSTPFGGEERYVRRIKKMDGIANSGQ